MLQNATYLQQKVAKKFNCTKCYYSTSRKSSWNKHLATQKHKMLQNATHLQQKVAKTKKTKTYLYFCDYCGKGYKHHSSFYRHKKLHEEKEKLQEEKEQNKKEMQKMIDLMNKNQSKMLEVIESTKHVNITNTTNNNQKISINVFLNEHCKGAMNLTDFIQDLQVTLQDLQTTNHLGYVDGYTNLLLKGLKELPTTERPIHCSDPKRQKFYVMEEGAWEKDDGGSKVEKAINDVTIKKVKQLRNWENEHPNYETDKELLLEWHKIIQTITGATEDQEKREKDKKEIMKQIGENLNIKTAIESLTNE
jgi:hypothetical protein